MIADNVPSCCTAVILHRLGEHGEESLVSVAEINRLCTLKANQQKRFAIAFTVDPNNIALFRDANFDVIATYPGVQGPVHVMARNIRRMMSEDL